MNERYSRSASSKLLRNQFTPIKISDFAYKQIKANSLERGEGDITRTIRSLANEVYYGLFNNSIINMD